MTNTSFWRIGADVPDKTRAFLLRRFKPSFAVAQCKTLTHAYKVLDSLAFPEGNLRVGIYGIHKAETHEALLVRVNGQTFRPDGSRYFIALSIAAGEEPSRCSEIDSDSIEYLDQEIRLETLKFQRFPMWNRQVKRAA
jgi:hypothetical protein